MMAAKTRHPAGNVKHSLTIAGHRTSISLEDAFWQCLQRIAVQKAMPLADLVARIDAARGTANLSSAIRVHVLQSVLAQDTLPLGDGRC